MPGKKSAAKRHRQSETKRLRNRAVRSRVRTEIKKFIIASKEGRRETLEEQFRKIVSLLDKAAGKGVIHRNNAARKKSRLQKYLAKQQTT
ncbi:MAG: 30S ribosomal protein S20 [Spirochaetes bacterium]|nr:MAG: 30S ribosomal protein S20 [Spirochaetota bacterium]